MNADHPTFELFYSDGLFKIRELEEADEDSCVDEYPFLLLTKKQMLELADQIRDMANR